MTEYELRKNLIDTAKGYKGVKSGSVRHHVIVDTYNSYTPRARGYVLTYSDDWCAGFIGAVAVRCGLTDLIPMEVSVPRMVELAKTAGTWVENDAYVPRLGDMIVFYWADDGGSDAEEGANHIGFVVSVSNGKITTIEGNNDNAVGSRTLALNGRYIRGFICPNYASRADKPALDYAKSGPDQTKAGTYTVIAGDGRKLRTGAAITKRIIEHLPTGSKVTCYGYHTGSWLLVVSEAGNTGFCHRVNLRKD